MYLIGIQFFVFLLILSTAIAPGFVQRLLGSGSTSKHAVKYKDTTTYEGNYESTQETDNDDKISLYSTTQSTGYQGNSNVVESCKSQLNNEGYYDNVKANWNKARSRKTKTIDRSQGDAIRHERIYQPTTGCGKVYLEVLADVNDQKKPAFKKLKGVQEFCEEDSSCVFVPANETNYYRDEYEHYGY